MMAEPKPVATVDDFKTSQLPSIIDEGKFSEIWGVDLRDGVPEHVNIIIQNVSSPNICTSASAK